MTFAISGVPLNQPVMVAAAYLLGSIPVGYLLVRSLKGIDVRQTGSGGTGATNVARQAGKAVGLLTLALDASKGAVAVVLARWLLTSDFSVNWWVALCALAAVIGHVFPVWLGFRGGKGVATALGVFACLAPLSIFLAALVFVMVVWTTGYVSLGSVTGAALFPLCVWLLSDDLSATELTPVRTAAIIGSVLVIVMHHANITRLLRGTENKFR